MRGRTVLVTGGNSGIGFETAAALAGMGARVVLSARDPAKGTAAVEKILRRHPDADATTMCLDLARLDDVREFAAKFIATFGELHVLVNNAGVWMTRPSVTEDGFDTTFQVNHLGPFLLTTSLSDLMRSSAPARVVFVASEGHRFVRMGIDDLLNGRATSPSRIYLWTKLANIQLTRELARRLEGSGVTANSLHPGTVRTRIGRDGDMRGFMALGTRLTAPLLPPPSRGARTPVFLASSPDVARRTGEHWNRRRPRRPSRRATDAVESRTLWDVSAELVGV